MDITLADSHCHLSPPWFEMQEIDNVMKRAIENNVKIVVNSVIEPSKYSFGLKTTAFKGLYLTVGIEPPKINEKWMEKFTTFYSSNKDKIVAIGEVGLDYYWVKAQEKQKEQRTFFHRLVELSIKEKKPIVIHSRSAEQDAIEILQQYGKRDVLMHSFTGSEQQLKTIVNEGWYISIASSLVYRKNLQRILKATPVENLMLETDSPFHSLVRGKNNEPSAIAISARHAAKMLAISLEKLAEITTKNVKNFYRLR